MLRIAEILEILSAHSSAPNGTVGIFSPRFSFRVVVIGVVVIMNSRFGDTRMTR